MIGIETKLGNPPKGRASLNYKIMWCYAGEGRMLQTNIPFF